MLRSGDIWEGILHKSFKGYIKGIFIKYVIDIDTGKSNWIYQNAHEQEHTDEEDDIFSKYEYLFHSDGEVREPTFKRVWEDFRKACSEGAYSQKKLWDFMRSIVLGPAQNIAYGTIRKFRQETDDPIEIAQLTELMYEVEANEYMESVAENLHNKLD